VDANRARGGAAGHDHQPLPRPHPAAPGFEKDLAERTLTKLYNQRPAWLDAAHAAGPAVAAAYGWADYTPDMPDDEILRRLLAFNLAYFACGRVCRVICAVIKGDADPLLQRRQPVNLHIPNIHIAIDHDQFWRWLASKRPVGQLNKKPPVSADIHRRSTP
jgi:hypothetical protein